MCVNLENIKRNGEKKMNMTKEKTLSVVIPCYNEKDNIVSLVKKVLESPIENKDCLLYTSDAADE